MENAKHIVKRLFEEPWTGNFEAIDEFISPDYVGHDPAVPEPIRGPAGVRDNIERYIAGFPGGAITVDEQIAEGDKVATRWTGRGTHTGELAGISPTGKDVTVSGLTISRFEGGKVVEEWTTWDTLGMLVQLGVIPAPARAQKHDAPRGAQAVQFFVGGADVAAPAVEVAVGVVAGRVAGAVAVETQHRHPGAGEPVGQHPEQPVGTDHFLPERRTDQDRDVALAFGWMEEPEQAALRRTEEHRGHA